MVQRGCGHLCFGEGEVRDASGKTTLLIYQVQLLCSVQTNASEFSAGFDKFHIVSTNVLSAVVTTQSN